MGAIKTRKVTDPALRALSTRQVHPSTFLALTKHIDKIFEVAEARSLRILSTSLWLILASQRVLAISINAWWAFLRALASAFITSLHEKYSKNQTKALPNQCSCYEAGITDLSSPDG